MTSSSARLAILVAILLLGCADDTTRLAGGTGSDLPRPTARLLDTSLNLLDAKVWRLWQVYGDSAKATSQIVDSTGFVVPASGKWIVEAWKDSASAGEFDKSRRVKIAGKVDSCELNLTYLKGKSEEFVGVLQCLDIAAPSGGGRALMGLGVFGRADSIHRIVKMTTAALDAWRFLVWQVLPESTQRSVPGMQGTPNQNSTMLVRQPIPRYSPYRGLVDVTASKGIWLYQGWNGRTFDSLENRTWLNSLPSSMWVDSADMANCIKLADVCDAQIGSGSPAVSFTVIVK
jgi:hypothetical protein